MRKFLWILLATVSLSALAQPATVNVSFTFTDYGLTPQSVTRVAWTPLSKFADYNGNILAANPQTQVTGGAGSVTWSNQVPGYAYRIELDTVFGSTIRTCGIPTSVSGNINGLTYIGNIGGLANGGITTFYYLYTAPGNLLSTNAGTLGQAFIWLTAGTGYWGSVASSGGSATNAISQVSSNNVSQGTAVTNLNFWAGAGTTLNFTNRSGLVDVAITGVGNIAGSSNLFVVPQTLWVRTNGNNATAVRGDESLPYGTVEGAVASAKAYDTIQMGVGNFVISNALLIPANVALNGISPGLTFIQADTNIQAHAATLEDGRWIDLTNGITLANFTLQKRPLYPYLKGYPLHTYSTSGLITNVLIHNIRVYGDTDLGEFASPVIGDFFGCQFASAFDMFISGGDYRNHLRFFNCSVDGGTNVNGTAWGTLPNGSQNNQARYFTCINMTGTIELYGGEFSIIGGDPGQQSGLIVADNLIIDGAALTFSPKAGDVTQPIIAFANTNLTIFGHPYPENKVQAVNGLLTWVGDATNAPIAGGFMGAVNSAGVRAWSLGGGAITNVSALNLKATNGHYLVYTNTALMGNGWSAGGDALIAANLYGDLVILGSQGIFDTNGAAILIPIDNGLGSAENDYYGGGGSGPIKFRNSGTFYMNNIRLVADSATNALNNIYVNSGTYTNGITNIFLTPNQMTITGPNKEFESASLGAGLTLTGPPYILSSAGGAGGVANLAGIATNLTELGWLCLVNPTNSNNGTNWLYFTGTNWQWQNVGTNGGGGYRTNTFHWGNGSTSNVFDFLNTVGVQVIALDTNGNLTTLGAVNASQFNGSGAGLIPHTVSYNALPTAPGYSLIMNPNVGAAAWSSQTADLILEPIGNTIGGVPIRGISPGDWTNSAASALTALLSSATVTNVLQAQNAIFTNAVTNLNLTANTIVGAGAFSQLKSAALSGLTFDGTTLSVNGGTGLPGTNQIIAYGSAQRTNWSAEANGGWYETNTAGGVNIASNGVFSATGPSGVNGSLVLNDSGGNLEMNSTNGGGWFKNPITDSGATNTSLTASRVMLTDANKAELSATASGAVPIDADGTATTVVQLQNLGLVATNDTRALTLSGTNYWHGNNVWDGGQLIFSNGLQITGTLNVTNGIIQTTNTSGANQGITMDPSAAGSVFWGDNNQTNYLSIKKTSVIESNAYGTVELRGDSIISSNRNTGSYFSSTNGIGTNTGIFQAGGYVTAGALAFGAGTTGTTNTFAAQFNYNNLQWSTNASYGGVQSNGVANSTLTLKGFEQFVMSMGNTIVQLGDATTNLGHNVRIMCGSSGTNAITTVSSQKISGQTKWTNTVIYSVTEVTSDGSNWQISGARGN